MKVDNVLKHIKDIAKDITVLTDVKERVIDILEKKTAATLTDEMKKLSAKSLLHMLNAVTSTTNSEQKVREVAMAIFEKEFEGVDGVIKQLQGIKDCLAVLTDRLCSNQFGSVNNKRNISAMTEAIRESIEKKVTNSADTPDDEV